jgi:hypothetical protein
MFQLHERSDDIYAFYFIGYVSSQRIQNQKNVRKIMTVLERKNFLISLDRGSLFSNSVSYVKPGHCVSRQNGELVLESPPKLN